MIDVGVKQELINIIFKNGDITKFSQQIDLDQSFTNDDGNIIHFLAEQSSNQDITAKQLGKCVKIGEFILQKIRDTKTKSCIDAFINFKDNMGNTPLHLSVRAIKADFVYFLIKHGASTIKDLQIENQAIFSNISASDSLRQYRQTHKILNAEHKTAVDLAKEYSKELKQNNKQHNGTAAQAIENADQLFVLYAPREFVHKTRFSLRTAYMVGLVARIAYKGHGSDDKKGEADYDNEVSHAFLKRWGFKKTKIFQRDNARAIITEFDWYIESHPATTRKSNKQTVRIISFRGSKDNKDYLADGLAAIAVSGKCYGFVGHLEKISKILIDELRSRATTLPLYITGHSLGGAVASLFLMKLKHEVENLPDHDDILLYSFGQPRPGTEIFAREFYGEKFAKNVYVVQKCDDFVPSVPWYNLGFRHCGSVRYIDELDQLAGDIHYKMHDVRRQFSHSIPNSNNTVSLHKLRETWKNAFKLLIQLHGDPSNLGNHLENELIKISNEKVAASIDRKLSSNLLSTLTSNLTSLKNPVKSHSMNSYLASIMKMQERISLPFNNITESICSSAKILNISQELWDRMKASSSQEQVEVYKDWLSHYLTIKNSNGSVKITLGDVFRPDGIVTMNTDDDNDFDFTLTSNANNYIPENENEYQRIADTIEKWYTKEQEILQAIEECEGKIKSYFQMKNIKYQAEYANSIDFHVLLFPLTPLVCHGIQSICYLISQLGNKPDRPVNEDDKKMIYQILRKFYFSIPEDAPILTTISESDMEGIIKKCNKASSKRNKKNNEKLETNRNINVTRNILSFENGVSNENIKQGIIIYIEYLSKHDPCMNNTTIIQCLAQYLSSLPFKNGYRPSVAKERKEWNKKLDQLMVTRSSSSVANEKNLPRIRLIINNQVKEGYLHPKYKYSFDKKGKNVKYGRRVVYTLYTEENGEFMPDFYIKEFPELPGLERASEILAKQLVGEGIPCSTIGRIDYYINNNDVKNQKKSSRIQFGKAAKENKPVLVSIPILISNPVGTSLQYDIDNRQVMNRLDEKRFSQLIVLQILTLVEDAKVDNFQISKNEENGKWLLHAIDNDHIFVPPIVKNYKNDFLNFKSILFCCDQMRNQVDMDIKEQLEFLIIPNVIVKWLEELVIIDKLCVADIDDRNTDPSSLKLFTQEENRQISMMKSTPSKDSSVKIHAESNQLEKEAITGTIIQAFFAKDMVVDMCERIRKLQLLFKSVEKTTHETIFRDIHPTVAKIYLREFEKYETAHQRFNAITDKYYNTVQISSLSPSPSPSLTSSAPTPLSFGEVKEPVIEIKMTKKTGADIMKSAKARPNSDHSASQQLVLIIDFLSETDENSELAKGLLRSGRRKEFKKYFEKLSIPFREKFINTHLYSMLLECNNDNDKRIITDTICDVLLYMEGFTSLNLSNMSSPFIYHILIRNRATLESVILQNSSIPPLDPEEGRLRKINDDDLFLYGNWPLVSASAQQKIKEMERKASRFSIARTMKRNDTGNFHPKTNPAHQTFNFRDLYCLRKLKFIDVSRSNHLYGIFALLPSIIDEDLFGPILYKIEGLIELYHTSNHYPLELLMFFSPIRKNLHKFKILHHFGDNRNVTEKFLFDILPKYSPSNSNNIIHVDISSIFLLDDIFVRQILLLCPHVKSFSIPFGSSLHSFTNLLKEIFMHKNRTNIISLRLVDTSESSIMDSHSVEALEILATTFLHATTSLRSFGIVSEYHLFNADPLYKIFASNDCSIEILEISNSIHGMQGLFQCLENNSSISHLDLHCILEHFVLSKYLSHSMDVFGKSLSHLIQNNKSIKCLTLRFKNKSPAHITIDTRQLKPILENILSINVLQSIRVFLSQKQQTEEFDFSTMITSQHSSLLYPPCRMTNENYDTQCIPFFQMCEAGNVEAVAQLLEKDGKVTPYIPTRDDRFISEFSHHLVKDYLSSRYPYLSVLPTLFPLYTATLTDYHSTIPSSSSSSSSQQSLPITTCLEVEAACRSVNISVCKLIESLKQPLLYQAIHDAKTACYCILQVWSALLDVPIIYRDNLVKYTSKAESWFSSFVEQTNALIANPSTPSFSELHIQSLKEFIRELVGFIYIYSNMPTAILTASLSNIFYPLGDTFMVDPPDLDPILSSSAPASSFPFDVPGKAPYLSSFFLIEIEILIYNCLNNF